MASIFSAPTRNLDVVTLHEILRLRQDVFVVEQECAYPDIDGRDLEPGTVQWWSGNGSVDATLRVLHQPDGTERIGRVATARGARGTGLASELIRAAIDSCRSGSIAIDAQSHLRDWYARFGFVQTGDEFIEDGIPHVPMTLTR
ncbi:GNAT family N-acetyltransferase [Curtobacterium sp. MCBD17_034]|uniref:GNAT family N-acetyltransferase n=1 Tax=unclassified Curtobacterium TaxID=257496 RepID=UPI000DA99830|nr:MULTISPECIES: GNAT family N-acetyltransferase [unclassified Curtobacterium]PZE74312.1 GNAT family N-acetyltransferase [Curtobacterium sp. MCBD17_019]PZF58654.1 GNAT family N-acetyltransferase [Curtobacterium sp. MCBD17_034]PZF64296.1 GNAT family N-acetyltransferase [Curtobacterium sp. MCBD17_013]PZM34644.1 GNAT family N-acetyltransferase [Curtobacterium sp. MCBD17_031]WIE53726.1 GNAT family N-acetyltransferase [Curtobacterium sp. MCBD17_003]